MTTYPKYKPSGIEWIGDIPDQWNPSKIKFVATIYGRIGYRGYTNDDIVQRGEGIISLSPGNIRDNKLVFGESTYIKIEKYYESPEIQIFKNDVIFVKTGSTIGKVAIVDEIEEFLTLNPQMVVFKNVAIERHFLFYFLQSEGVKGYFETNWIGGAAPTISQEKLSSLPICFPHKAEQFAIATFLDTKTTQIDTCITKKQKLIELLKEEKTAIINEAVTKGITPDVKLKPSGIEWLGDVPEHWKQKKVKFCGDVKYGLGQPPKLKEDGLPLIRATNVYRGAIDTKNLIFVDPDDIPYDRDPVLKENDIIVVRSGAYTADSAIIPKTFEGAITGYDMVFRANSINAKFVAYCFLSHYVLRCQLIPQSLRAAQPHLNREELNETILIVPPFVEQETLVDYLNKSTSKIDHTISRIEKEIELMQEYRVSLISEVATGKVRVA